MDKDKILDNSKQCKNVECDSESKQNVHDDCVEHIPEEDLCMGGGASLNQEDKSKIKPLVDYGAPNKMCPCVAYGGPNILPKIPIVKYGGPKTFENKELKDLADNKSTKEE